MEGRSLLSVFKGDQRKPHDQLFWSHARGRAVLRRDEREEDTVRQQADDLEELLAHADEANARVEALLSGT